MVKRWEHLGKVSERPKAREPWKPLAAFRVAGWSRALFWVDKTLECIGRLAFGGQHPHSDNPVGV